ncbi:MAG: hypothetical protein NZM07_01725 [Elioraea sp.]|nr:hypothetical protein [Elioraea sp.]
MSAYTSGPGRAILGGGHDSPLAAALAPLAARMPRPVVEHRILAVRGEIVEAPLAAVREAVLAWAENKAGLRLPDTARTGESFRHESPGRNLTCVALRREADRGEAEEFWGLRAEDPDSAVPGRIWATEILLCAVSGAAIRFDLRLAAAATQGIDDVAPAVPRFPKGLPGRLLVGGIEAAAVPHRAGTEAEADRLSELLVAERRCPVVVLSIAEGAAGPALDAEALARRLHGLAHVWVVAAPMTFRLTEHFGKKLSCYNGAVRLYLPGFAAGADPYAHRLLLPHLLADEAGRQEADRWLRRRVAELSLQRAATEPDALTFARLRAEAEAERERQARLLLADVSDRLRAAEERISKLEKDLREQDAAAAQLLAEAEAKRQAAADRAAEAESCYRLALARLQALVPSGASARTGLEARLPGRWSEFADWVDEALVGRLVLTRRARRQVARPLFQDVTLAARCLSWLATEYREARIAGGRPDLPTTRLTNDIVNARCGQDSFAFEWEGRRLTCEWHIKNGGTTRDPARCLRIYYCWDEETQQVVVAEMPAHRETGAS